MKILICNISKSGTRRWRGKPSPTLPMNQIASDLPPLGFKSSFPFENPKRCALESAYGTTWQKDAVLHFCPAMKIRRHAHEKLTHCKCCRSSENARVLHNRQILIVCAQRSGCGSSENVKCARTPPIDRRHSLLKNMDSCNPCKYSF